MANITDERLRTYVIWLPMVRNDNREAAVKRSGDLVDPRVIHYWDESLVTGKIWQKVMNIPRTAWDVYFLYNTYAKWDAYPDKPDFFMHQLRDMPAEQKLNRSVFEAKAKEMLND